MKVKWISYLILSGFFILPISHGLTQRQITIDDIWTNGTYQTKSVPGFRFMNDGHHYTSLRHNMILKYDLTSGKLVDTILNVNSLPLPADQNLIDGYTFSDDESQILLTT